MKKLFLFCLLINITQAQWFDTGLDLGQVKTIIADTATVLRGEMGEDTTYREDLRFPVGSIRLPASNPPTATAYVGSQVLAFSESADNILYFQAQIPHNAVNSSNAMYSDSIYFHIHCAYETNGSSPDSVAWVFTYSWSNIDGTISEPTTVNKRITVTTRLDSTQYLEDIAAIPTSGKTASSMLLMSLTRDVSEDDYGADVYLLEVDIHYLARKYSR